MKFFLAALVLGVSSLVAAQAPATLGTCGVSSGRRDCARFIVCSRSSANMCSQTTCVNGMVAKMQAAPYNCASGDEACYCRQADFGNGIRDCANEACGNAMLAASVISFAGQYCNGERCCPCVPRPHGIALLTRFSQAALATVASSTVVVVVAASSSASAVVTVTVSTTTVGTSSFVQQTPEAEQRLITDSANLKVRLPPSLPLLPPQSLLLLCRRILSARL